MPVKTFSVLERRQALERLAEEELDLAVVGGGINGAGIARDAAMRGLSVAVFEKGDFASGTSSKSSKLVHGGVRYLEHYQFGLVHEASVERRVLLTIAPHLVRPLGFLMPVFAGARHGPLFINLGLWLYDALAMFGNVKMHRGLSPADLGRLAPGLRTDLLGGSLFYDAQTDDARLTLETLRSAHAAGALALNYACVTGFLGEGGRVAGVVVEDGLTGERVTVRARVVVNAAGPWLDAVRKQLDRSAPELLRVTKGVHVVLPAGIKDLEHAIVLVSPDDGRVLFAIPWEGMLLVGTTDTDFDGDRDRMAATPEEVDYLLASLASYFPGLKVGREDVVATFAGLRPLLGTGAEGKSESAVSREHCILEEPSGLLTLAGGKLTTYRKMAEQVVDRVARRLPASRTPSTPSRTATVPLRAFAAGGAAPDLKRLSSGLEPGVLARFSSRFPGEEATLLQWVREAPSLAEPLAAGSPYLAAEVVFACRYEMAATLSDLMMRRTHLFFRGPDQGLAAAPTVARLAGEVLGWDEPERKKQLENYERAVTESRAFRE